MNIVIRRIEADDMEAALELVWEVFWEYEAPDYSEQGTAEFYNMIHEPQWLSMLQVYGAYHQGELAGVIAARSHGSHIALFFVKGVYHKNGIGRKLFERFLNDSSANTITVNASPYAVPVYHRLGFQETDKEQTANGIRYIPMELHL